VALMRGDFAEAIAPFATAQRMEPNNPMIRAMHGQVLAMSGDLEAGRAVLTDLVRDMPDNFFSWLAQLYLLALDGDRAAFLEAVTEDLKAAAASDPFYTWNLAECFALAGEHAEAVEWLQRAVDRGFINYPLLAEKDPFLASLRERPDFLELMTTVKARWTAFEV
jgi:non-specific serine/threonine protein kinase